MPLLVHFPASQRALFKPDGETAYWQSSAAALFLEFSNFFKKDLLLKDYIAELVYSKFLTTPTREMRQTQSLGWAIPPLIGLQGRRVWSCTKRSCLLLVTMELFGVDTGDCLHVTSCTVWGSPVQASQTTVLSSWQKVCFTFIWKAGQMFLLSYSRDKESLDSGELWE